MPNLVFVFGTLKEGFPNFATNKGARVGGTFVTVERYPLYLVGERFTPWLVDAIGEGEQVVGQVFEVDEPALAAMDALERITEPDGYRRVMLEVEALGDAQRTTLGVQVYIKPREQLAPTEVRLGPLQEYTLEHAKLYRRRSL
ncbi:MAG: gamma-glutamylcyclotransferase [Variovorax sp.]|nr:gamma-glutamylcyclotransferase [Variovorax sp.]